MFFLIISQPCLHGYIAWNTYKQEKPYFRETVKKLGNKSDLSARPATSSMTIRRLIASSYPSSLLSTYSDFFLHKIFSKEIKFIEVLQITKTHLLLVKTFSNKILTIFAQGNFENPKSSCNFFSKKLIFTKLLNKCCLNATCSADYENVPLEFTIVGVVISFSFHPALNIKSKIDFWLCSLYKNCVVLSNFLQSNLTIFSCCLKILSK